MDAIARHRATPAGVLRAIWGLGGVVALLGFAVYRLTPIAVDALDHAFDWRHWALLVAHTVFMAYSEGYKGFQAGFSPRVVARARVLVASAGPLRALLAPLFCMGYFHTTRRRLVSAYLLTAAIIALIVAFQMIPQPWRGILDAGVVLGLAWGMASIVAFAWREFVLGDLHASPELPAAATADPGR